MTSDPVNGGLTEMGAAIVEQMIQLGMVIDVAHAHSDTLRDITEIAHSFRKPVVDSHTSPSYQDGPLKSRVRSWQEIEMIAETGAFFAPGH